MRRAEGHAAAAGVGSADAVIELIEPIQGLWERFCEGAHLELDAGHTRVVNAWTRARRYGLRADGAALPEAVRDTDLQVRRDASALDQRQAPFEHGHGRIAKARIDEAFDIALLTRPNKNPVRVIGVDSRIDEAIAKKD